MKNWTDARLERLFARYNRRYWRGRLIGFAVHVQKLGHLGYVGRCDPRKREILIDTDALRSDRKIRDTLLHEMAHAAAPGDGHGYAFWAQLEKLLRQGAPIRCGIPETGGAFRILAGVIPRKFPRARKAMERIEAARNRKILTAARYSRAQFHQTTEDEIVARFSDLAPGMTERAAVLEVGIEYGLIDVGLKPVNRWAARIIDRGRKAFRLRRRDYLMDQRRWKLLAAGEGTKRRLAEISC